MHFKTTQALDGQPGQKGGLGVFRIGQELGVSLIDNVADGGEKFAVLAESRQDPQGQILGLRLPHL